MITIDEVLVADDPAAWQAAGFTVVDGTCTVGSVRIVLTGAGEQRGITGWSLRGIPAGTTELDGLPTTASTASAPSPAEHPLGATALDHLVVMSPDLDRTVAVLGAVGLEARRVRDFELGGSPMRQVFLRLGETILELVGTPEPSGDGPATFWGLTHTVGDIDAAAALLGERAGRVKDAVQPGRRITTLRTRELGISVATALMTPQPPRR